MRSRVARGTAGGFLSFSLSAAALIVAGVILRAQAPPPDPPEPLASLKTVPVPEPGNLAEFVVDKAAAIRR